VQEPYILLISALGLLLFERIVGLSEPHRRKQVVLVAILRKGPRFTNQRVDDMPIVDPMLVVPAQSRHGQEVLCAKVQIKRFGPHPDKHGLANQARGH
jgi:hypothetical protein